MSNRLWVFHLSLQVLSAGMFGWVCTQFVCRPSISPHHLVHLHFRSEDGIEFKNNNTRTWWQRWEIELKKLNAKASYRLSLGGWVFARNKWFSPEDSHCMDCKKSVLTNTTDQVQLWIPEQTMNSPLFIVINPWELSEGNRPLPCAKRLCMQHAWVTLGTLNIFNFLTCTISLIM